MMEGGSLPSAADAMQRVLNDSGDAPPPKRIAVQGDTAAEIIGIVTKLQQQQQQFMVAMMQQNEMNTRAMALMLEKLATPADVPAPAATAPSFTKNEMATIPKELDEVILRRTRGFKDSVFKVSRARNLLDKFSADAATFNGEDMRYPNSVPTCKTQTTLVELDSPLAAAAGSPHSVSIELPQNCTRRDALKVFHHAWCKFRANVMVEAQAEHLQIAETMAHPAELEKIVKDVLEEASKPSLAESFGLPKPLSSGIDEAIVKKRVQDIYDKIFAALNKKLESDKLAAERSKSAVDESEKQLLSKAPDQLLGELVSNEVNIHLKKAGLVSQMDEGGDDAHSPKGNLTSDLIDAIHNRLGNELSPSAVVGQNPKFVKPRPKKNGKVGPYRPKEGKGKGSSSSGKNGGKKGKKGGKRQEW